MRNLAIIPARIGSKRLRNKNIKRFLGKPLLSYAIEVAKQSDIFDVIHVSTESEKVATVAESQGISTDFFRPVHLATDNATLNDVCLFVVEKYQELGLLFDNMCMIWATSPLLKPEDINNSFKLLGKSNGSVIGVTEYDLPFNCASEFGTDNVLRPVFPDLQNKRRSDLPKYVCDNGSFCWVKIDSFLREKSWQIPLASGYFMPKERSVDIDTEYDWELAKHLCKTRVQRKPHE